MKLFVIAALVAVAAAGRLEHLERNYLPPDSNTIGSSFGSNGGFGSGQGGFGSHSSHGGFGSQGSHGGFGSHGAHGSFGGNSGAFGGATSNQYLPPDHGPSASSGSSQFAGSLQGFGAQNYHSQQYSQRGAPAQQYSIPSTQYGTPQGPSSFGAHNQYSQQSAAASRQYLAPNVGSSQNIPQQAFDEETGYHY